MVVNTDDPPASRRIKRLRFPRIGTGLLSMAGLLLLALPADRVGPARKAPTHTPSLPRVTVAIDAKLPGKRIPRQFLGLSFELSSAQQIAEYADRGDLVKLLRSLGPGVLRLGGASADTRVAWVDTLTPRPAWASSVLDVADLRALGRLARRSGWHVLLTLGLAHFEEHSAAREVAAAKAALGPWLAGIEVGNEPDSYARHALRELPWTPSQYESQVSAYRHAIAAKTPGIAVAGPGVSGSRAFQRWGPAEVRAQNPALLTGHHYPLSCNTIPTPSIEGLLSPVTREKEAASLARFMAVAHASSIPFRLDETNTVSCGGKAGISNTFASTLWAVGYIARTMAAGAVGINLQGNPANCLGYSPLCAPTPSRLAAGALHAQPEWYALLLAKELVDDRPLPSRIVSATKPNLTVSALRTPRGGLHFVIVQDEPSSTGPLTVRLRVGPRFRTASILTLSAPSRSAQSGVTLGGRAVAADGSWHASAGGRTLEVHKGIVSVTVPAASAMLVTVTKAGAAAG